MSRIGKQPVIIPKEVKLKVDGGRVSVEGARGRLELALPSGIKIESTEDRVQVVRSNDTKQLKSLHGTIRVLIDNMVKGVTQGFKKDLELVGVGYKAQMKGKKLALNIGFSHPVEMELPVDIKVTVSGPTRISVEGIDRQKVGEFAAKIRKNCPPEPYKGKGIRYVGEEVRKKLGKALAK